MAALLSGESSSHRTPEEGGGGWYFSRKEIEENSPSRKDGISLKHENHLRKTYSILLQRLGNSLNVPQKTIATAVVFCHRFFIRQSHAKNDCRIIAISCMFLACKVEETFCPLSALIQQLGYMLKKKRGESEQVKELIFLGERMVLTTLAFDLIVTHPYKPLWEALKKFNLAQDAVVQSAWNFVNDGFATSLCLQFKPEYIAAVAFYLSVKVNKVKLPSDVKKVWRKEFDDPPLDQLEEIYRQLLEFKYRNRQPQSQPSEAEGSERRTANEEHLTTSSAGNEGHEEDDDRGKTLSSDDDRTVAQLTQDFRKKLDVDKIKAALKKRKALGGDIACKVDPTDELEKELEDVELPGKSRKIEHEDDLEEGEIGPLDSANMGDLSPGASTGKSEPGEPLDAPVEGDQRSDSA